MLSQLLEEALALQRARPPALGLPKKTPRYHISLRNAGRAGAHEQDAPVPCCAANSVKRVLVWSWTSFASRSILSDSVAPGSVMLVLPCLARVPSTPLSYKRLPSRRAWGSVNRPSNQGGASNLRRVWLG